MTNGVAPLQPPAPEPGPAWPQRALAWLAALRRRLRARPDTEHEQALIRVFIAPLMVVYLYASLRFGQIDIDAFDGVLVAIVLEMVVAIGLVVAIVRQPGISHVRRIVGMLTDYGTSGLAMYLIGEAGAPFVALFLWMTIGNGHRFGRNYLRLAIAMAGAGFVIVVATTPFWQQHLVLSTSLLIAILAIPAYQERLLSALIEAKEESTRANRAKTWFLASTSHELRTPLTGVIGMIDALEATPLRDDQATYVRVARASARSLLALVHDVLDIAAIEAGRLQITNVDFSLREMLADIETMLGTTANLKGLQFEIDTAADVPDALHGDRDHLRQILVNLIANAVKFTERGFVRILVRRAQPQTPHTLRFDVCDSGIGIPEQARAKIFEAFAQAHTGRDRRFGGTGLGTTIARELTAQLGGQIGFDSEEGRGTTFWVVLPFAAATVPAEAAHPVRNVRDEVAAHRAALTALEVLVVDDQPTNRLVIRELLTQAGHRVYEADGGDAALELLAGQEFDLVISDFHMPGLTGLDMLRELRAMQAPDRATPFILLTADLTNDARRDADIAGVSAFLSKPIDSVRLLHTIEAVVRGEVPPPPPAELPARAMPAPWSEQSVEQPVDPAILQELAEASSNASFLGNFVRSSLHDAKHAVELLEAAGRRADWDDFRDRAHAIKGITANIGAVRVAALAGAAMRRDALALPSSWASDCTGIRRALQAAEAGMDAVLATIQVP